MADQGGIFLTFPTADPIGTADIFLDDLILARRYTCPGSGAQDINEIGGWVGQRDSALNVRYVIYNDDGGAPGTDGDYVTNSLTGEIAVASADAWTSHIYSPKPQLTGGVDYWPAIWGQSNGGAFVFSIERWSFGGGTNSTSPQVYDTDPPAGESWAGNSNTSQIALEYQAAAVGVGIPIIQYYNNRRRRFG